MKNVIRFTRVRRAMYALSLTCIIGGLIVTALRGGFNWSVDFTGGVSKDFQVAPRALTLRHEGQGRALVSLAGDVLSLRRALPGEDEKSMDFSLRNYPRIGDVAAALRMIDGVAVTAAPGVEALPSSLLLPLSFPADLAGAGAALDRVLAESEEPQASIDIVRHELAELGDFSLQTVGRPRDQAFVVKLAAIREEGSADYLARVDRVITERLSARFAGSDVLLRQTSFVGAMFSADLVRAAFWSILVALILIMIYASVRFKFVYAAAAVLALVHDASFMVAFVGAFGVEFTAATVAALLTIIGYSINDTIVVFDRVRENFGLMPHAERALVIDTSITQTLGRTIITNLTAQMAVITIFIIGTGTIRDFAKVMTVGMVVGTYSSIFIAAPLVLGWQEFLDKRRKAREGGVKPSRAPLHSSEAGRA